MQFRCSREKGMHAMWGKAMGSIILVSLFGGQSSKGQTGQLLQAKPVDFGLFDSGRSDTFATINAAFTPDGRTVYFSKSHEGWAGLTIFVSHRDGKSWTEPEVAPFSGMFRDADPAVSPDGKSVIFASMRDREGKGSKIYSLFRATIGPDGSLNVHRLADTINNGTNVLSPSIARDGTLYFIRSTGKTVRIFRSELRDGDYSAVAPVDLPDDSDTVFDSDPTIAPDQSFIVFSSNRPDSLGSYDLYLSFRHGNQWCKPVHLDASINSTDPEIATGLSPDGRTLYFGSSRSVLTQPRTVRADAIAFRSEVSGYENGITRTYQADLKAWLNEHTTQAQSCITNK